MQSNAQRYAVLNPFSPRLEEPEHYSTASVNPAPQNKETTQGDEASRTKSPSASSKTFEFDIVEIPDTPANINNSDQYNKLEIDQLFLKNTYSKKEIDDFSNKNRTPNNRLTIFSPTPPTPKQR